MEEFILRKGDCMQELSLIDQTIDMVFADPPYFLSTGNGTVKIGNRYVSFDKGEWDHSRSRKRYINSITNGFHFAEKY